MHVENEECTGPCAGLKTWQAIAMGIPVVAMWKMDPSVDCAASGGWQLSSCHTYNTPADQDTLGNKSQERNRHTRKK
jgi:hypothetical protein